MLRIALQSAYLEARFFANVNHDPEIVDVDDYYRYVDGNELLKLLWHDLKRATSIVPIAVQCP